MLDGDIVLLRFLSLVDTAVHTSVFGSETFYSQPEIVLINVLEHRLRWRTEYLRGSALIPFASDST